MMWEGLGKASTPVGNTQSYLYSPGSLYNLGLWLESVPLWVADSLTSIVQGTCMMWEDLDRACTLVGSTQSYLYSPGCRYDVRGFG